MTETTMEALAAQQALVLGVLGWLLATGLALVLAAVLAVGIVGFAIDKLLSLVEAWLLRWRKPGL